MVEHEPNNQRFIIRKDGHECVLDYQLEGQNVNFTHTYVPFALRGQGLAEKLVQAGLGWANEQKLHIKADCSYVQRFL